jgi:hypothetical protein
MRVSVLILLPWAQIIQPADLLLQFLDYSTLFGSANAANGQYSTGFGSGNTLGGFFSTSFGVNNNMSGDYSTGIGSGLQSNSLNAFVIGQNNIIDNGNSTSWIPTDPLFIIGNGNTSQSNAVTVLKNGNVGINSIAPQTSLDVNGTGSFTGLRMPTGAGANLFLTSDATGTASWASLPAAPAITQFWGGSLTGDVNNLNSGNVQIGPTPIGGLKSLRSKLEVYNNSATGFQVPIIAPVAYFQSNYGNQYFNLSLLNFSGSNPNQLLGANFFDGTNSHQLISISNTGKTIIGNATSAGTMLDVQGGGATIKGKVGIGVSSPSEELDVLGNIKVESGNNIIWGNNSLLFDNQGGSIELGGNNSVAGVGTPYIDFHYSGTSGDYNTRIINNQPGTLSLMASTVLISNGLRIPTGAAQGNILTSDGLGNATWATPAWSSNASGSIAIGTTCVPPVGSPYKLAVNGTIVCKEINVEMPVSGCFPDYVFEKDYKLTPLHELEKFIAANKHLPEIPSAKEVEENGMKMGEMNVLLLKKIEELTLHLIEQDKKIKELQTKINK